MDGDDTGSRVNGPLSGGRRAPGVNVARSAVLEKSDQRDDPALGTFDPCQSGCGLGMVEASDKEFL